MIGLSKDEMLSIIEHRLRDFDGRTVNLKHVLEICADVIAENNRKVSKLLNSFINHQNWINQDIHRRLNALETAAKEETPN